ncbi:anti-sigma factor antagonist [Streptomyces sp. NPDC058457]|uniref:caspase, EACC1-associated type n=1 Tax=Streptomyces sp. NPDC058457 TaxID=3346507 RepID=UPI00364FD182
MILDPADLKHVGEELNRAAQTAEDLLLFYYSGHGLIATRRHDLYLSLASTDYDNIPSSAVPFDFVRDTFLASPAKNRVIILDCCFSGRAIDRTLSPGTEEDTALQQIPVSGTYTITSTSGNKVARSGEGHRNTVFTELLLHAVRNGIPGERSLLSFGAVFREIVRTARADGQPVPESSGTGTSAEGLALAPNRSHPQYSSRATAPTDTPPSPQHEDSARPHKKPHPDLGLSVTTRRDSGWLIIETIGDIDVYTAPLLRSKIIESAQSAPAAIMIDLSEADTLDSTGLGVLAGALKRFHSAGIPLRLVIENNEHIERIFRITGLEIIFSIYPSLQDACSRPILPEYLEFGITGISKRRHRGRRPPIDAYTKEDLQILVRWIDGDGKGRSHQEMQREMADILGFHKCGARIRAAFDEAIAAERGERILNAPLNGAATAPARTRNSGPPGELHSPQSTEEKSTTEA